MRNTLAILISVLFSSLLAGCESQPKATELDRARDALVARDYSRAETGAQTYLARDPDGPRAAEAYYIQGRALEDAVAVNAQQARENLQAARNAYINALKAVTIDRALEGLIRASLADVAYWQDDFATSAEQGQAAYAMLEEPNAKAWTLYRTGVSQQRLGRFDDADKTLRMVQEYHLGSEPAQRAVARIGVRGFNIQVATFANAAAADTVVANLQKQGYASSKRLTGSKTVIFAGPYKSWGQASNARARLLATYPDALIVP